MRKKLILSAALIAVSFTSFAQVGVGTNSPKAGLDITSDKGMLLPRIADHTTLTPVDGTLDANEAGLQVYNTTTNKVMLWTGTAWVASATGTAKFVDGTDPLDAVYLDGNVGIGTATPSGTLEVVGTQARVGFNRLNSEMTISQNSLTGPASEFLGGDLHVIRSSDDPYFWDSAVRLFTFSGSGNTQSAGISLNTANGTKSTPLFVGANRTIGSFSISSINANNPIASVGSIRIEGKTASAHSETNGEMDMLFYTTPKNSISRVERMRILGNGNVGIGTNSPLNTLSVQSTNASISSGVASVTLNSPSNNPIVTFSQVGEGGISNAFQGLKITVQGQNSGLGKSLSVLTNNSNLFGGALTEIFTVQNGGNVGIGTATPTTKLEVNGAIKVGDAVATPVDGMIAYGDKGSGVGFYGYTGGAWVKFH